MSIGVVIVTHYRLGEEFLQALRLIVPDAPEFGAVAIDPTQSVDEMRSGIKAALEADNGKRTELYRQVQDLLIDEMPMVWLFDTPSMFFHHKDLFFPAFGTAENWDVMYWKKPQG